MPAIAPIMVFAPEPPVFAFPRVHPGQESVDQTVTVGNVGAGDLVLGDFRPDFGDEFRLYFSRDDSPDQVLAVEGGVLAPGFDRLVIEPAHSLSFVLSYKSAAGFGPQGELRFRTNDVERTNAVLPILGEGEAPEISVSPSRVDFGAVTPGSIGGPLDVAVTNLGTIALHILDARVSGPFRISIGGVDADAGALADPDADGEPGLAPMASFFIGVRAEPLDRDAIQGTLSISSDDSGVPTTDVPLLANVAVPCIHVTPGEGGLRFGGVALGETARKPFTIESCGSAPLQIDEITLSEERGALSLVPESVPFLPALMPAMSPGEPLPYRDIRVECRPTGPVNYAGSVRIASNDPLSPEVHLDVTCEGLAQ